MRRSNYRQSTSEGGDEILKTQLQKRPMETGQFYQSSALSIRILNECFLNGALFHFEENWNGY